MKSFHCTQCGLCCRNIGHVPFLHKFHNGDGICKFLDRTTNLCLIYANRPTICNVEAAYTSYFSKIYSEEEYLALNYEACKQLKNMR